MDDLLASAGGLLTAPEPDGRSELQLGGDLGENIRVHDGRTHLGHVAFGRLGVGRGSSGRRRRGRDGVAQELEALVRRIPAGLCAPGAVRHGLDEQRRVVEGATRAGSSARSARRRSTRRDRTGALACQAAPSLATT